MKFPACLVGILALVGLGCEMHPPSHEKPKAVKDPAAKPAPKTEATPAGPAPTFFPASGD
jgi:hypothetical protein